jgi:arabinose-5-phosphate isomerase
MSRTAAPPFDAVEFARKVLRTEGDAILGLIPRVDARFDRALDLLHACTGRVVVTGMGKSGIIAHKLAATFSSTGTPAVFLHAAEAVHGDLGMVQTDDVVVALSYSGETEELIRLLEAIRRIGARLIALTGHPTSTLGAASDVAVDCRITEEACPMNLAPTASTTATLAMGDALAMALAHRKGFQPEHFADLHPGGRLGRRLMRVDAVMHGGPALPAVRPETSMPDLIQEISSKRLGMTCVIDGDGRLEGVVTDGDLRRHMTPGSDLFRQTAAMVMTPRPVTIRPGTLAAEALRVMEERKITSVVVVDEDGLVKGVVHLHDLWRTQLV